MHYYALHGEPTRIGNAVGNDGTTLAWEVFGEPSPTGRPAIVCCNGVGCSTFFWHYICRYFSQEGEVLLWDYRGHGMSAPPADGEAVTMEDNADDLEAVLEAAGLRDVVLVGHSMGCQVILEYERRHPGRARALVPMLGTYGRAIDTFFNNGLTARAFPTLRRLAHRFHAEVKVVMTMTSKNPLTPWVSSVVGLVNGTMIKAADLKPYTEHMAALDVRLFMDMVRHLGEHSTEDFLEDLQIPVLIIGGERDVFTPVWLSERMHRMIEGSEMLIIPGGSHAALVEQPELINLRIEKFLAERVEGQRADGSGRESLTSRILEDTSDTRAHLA